MFLQQLRQNDAFFTMKLCYTGDQLTGAWKNGRPLPLDIARKGNDTMRFADGLPGRFWLAPMAGVTDYAYRTICAGLGAEVTVTEMVSSRALVYQDKKSRTLLRNDAGSACGVPESLGNDPAIMAEAAGLALEASGCDSIDINMGCPMPKVAGTGDTTAPADAHAGAGGPHRPGRDEDAVPVPVTVKMRTGWDKGSINCVELAKICQDNGAAAVAVHGRDYRTMLYSGTADWDIIRCVKEALTIPVIANGDIISPQAATRCLARTGADGLMVGRGCFGDPWVIRPAAGGAGGGGEPGPGRRWRCALAWRRSSLLWPWRTRASISPAWRPGSISPGICGACHIVITTRSGSQRSVPRGGPAHCRRDPEGSA